MSEIEYVLSLETSFRAMILTHLGILNLSLHEGTKSTQALFLFLVLSALVPFRGNEPIYIMLLLY